MNCSDVGSREYCHIKNVYFAQPTHVEYVILIVLKE